MYKQLILCWMIFVVCCSGCSTMLQKTPEVMTVTPTPLVVFQPNFTLWEMVDQPILSTEDYDLYIYAGRVTGQETVLLYYRIGAESELFANLDTTVQLRDDAGRTSNIISTGTFAVLDKIEVGFLKFSPRPKGASELYLQIRQDSSETGFIELLIAQLTHPPEDPSVYDIRTYFLSVDQIVEPDGFRISLVGWFPPSLEKPSEISGANDDETENLVTTTPDAPLPTELPPTPVAPIVTDLPEGTTVAQVVTLKIEKGGGQIFYIYVQFLSNGEVVGVLIEGK